MDDYLYSIEGKSNNGKGFYTIEDCGRKLILKPSNNGYNPR